MATRGWVIRGKKRNDTLSGIYPLEEKNEFFGGTSINGCVGERFCAFNKEGEAISLPLPLRCENDLIILVLIYVRHRHILLLIHWR